MKKSVLILALSLLGLASGPLYAGTCEQPVVATFDPFATRIYQAVRKPCTPAPVTDSQRAVWGPVVDGLYQSNLGRSPEPAGRDAWIRLLASNGGNIEAARAGIRNSAEGVQKQLHPTAAQTEPRDGTATAQETEIIVNAYRKYLGRNPDPAGFTHWLRQLRIGGIGAVETGILTSDEFARRFPR